MRNNVLAMRGCTAPNCRPPRLWLRKKGAPEHLAQAQEGAHIARALETPHLRESNFPDPWISLRVVLLANMEFTDDGTLPYWVFDALRLKHDIDVTGMNFSRTHGGQLYAAYALGDGRMPKRHAGPR